MTERELPWLAPRAALQLVSQLGLGRGDGLQHGLQLPLCDDEVERRRDRGHLIGGGVRVRLRVRVRVRVRLRLRLRLRVRVRLRRRVRLRFSGLGVHLRGVALRAVGLRRVRVYLGGGGVGCVGHARAQA